MQGHFKPFSPIFYSNYNANKGTSQKICLRRHLKKDYQKRRHKAANLIFIFTGLSKPFLCRWSYLF